MQATVAAAIPHPTASEATDREALVIAILLLGFAGISLPRLLPERTAAGWSPPVSGRPKKSEKKPGNLTVIKTPSRAWLYQYAQARTREH
jgi:hypothetical protein